MRLVATSDPARPDRHWHELVLKDEDGNEHPLRTTVDPETGEVKLTVADPA